MPTPARLRKCFQLILFLALAAGYAHAQDKLDPDSLANSGRKQLTDYLNNLAATETKARRATIARITTKQAAQARQRVVRQTILDLLGSLPERIPLNPRITGTTELDGVRVDKVLVDSQPNFPITALLYTPVQPATETKFPAIVMAPGHSPAGKAGDVAFATAFARAGFVVLSYDPIGQGERLQYLDPKSTEAKPTSLASRPTGEHGEAGLQPTLIGDALARYFLWDGMRAVDYLASLPLVDPQRIGAFGCSGGGAMTAMLAALDPRIAAAGVACYTTSFDTLLTTIGPQDSEQSIPNFIARGLDFPDWIELFAPKPYAIIATTADMFPFVGAQATEAESRRFYTLFAAGPNLAFLTGPGGHGNLRPLLPQILRFFTTALHPDAVFAANLPPLTDPFDATANPPRKPGPVLPAQPPTSLTQVTPTGQLASSYPGTASVFTLNQARAATITTPEPKSLADLQRAIRDITHAEVIPGKTVPKLWISDTDDLEGGATLQHGGLEVATGYLLPARTVRFGGQTFGDQTRHPARLVLVPDVTGEDDTHLGNAAVLTFSPRPSPPGTEETKSPLLGPFYLTELRAELTGKTLLGLRVDDVLRAVDFLAARPDVDPANITAEASGHLGLVLLHAAVLDPRLRHVTIRDALAGYRTLLDDPLPTDAPQDILPRVLRRYDIPMLIQSLGDRLQWDPLVAPPGSRDPKNEEPDADER